MEALYRTSEPSVPWVSGTGLQCKGVHGVEVGESGHRGHLSVAVRALVRAAGTEMFTLDLLIYDLLM